MTHLLSALEPIFGGLSTDAGEVTYSRAERRNTQQESDSKTPHNFSLTSESPV